MAVFLHVLALRGGSCPGWIRKAGICRSSIHSASRGFAAASQTAQTQNWCSLCWMAFVMVCIWAHWMEGSTQILGGAQMDEQSRIERLSYRQLCRMRWPRVVSWDHLLRHHLNSSSVRLLALCLSEIPPRFDSIITCHIHSMAILLMHSSLLKRQWSSIRSLRISLL